MDTTTPLPIEFKEIKLETVKVGDTWNEITPLYDDFRFDTVTVTKVTPKYVTLKCQRYGKEVEEKVTRKGAPPGYSEARVARYNNWVADKIEERERFQVQLAEVQAVDFATLTVDVLDQLHRILQVHGKVKSKLNPLRTNRQY